MPHFERTPIINPERISPERRICIGAQIVSCLYMRELSHHVDDISFINANETIAKQIMALLSEDEFAKARALVVEAECYSEIHLAAQQIGLTSDVHKTFVGDYEHWPNSDFIIATHYLEDGTYAGKLNAEIGLDGAFSDYEPSGLATYYMARSGDAVETLQDAFSIVESVRTVARDSEFWLEYTK